MRQLGLLGGTLGLMPVGFAFAETSFDLALSGQNFLAGKKYDQAIKVLEKAVAMDTSSDWALGLLGRAYYGAGQGGKAIAAFRKALIINPSDSYSRMMVEIISQRPVKKVKKAVKPMTALEREALAEEKEMLAALKKGSEGEGYQVRRVVIDPGHGGFDPGAVGRGGLKEKDVVLDIGKRLHERLNKHGRIKSFLTRTGDYYVPLGERTVTANQHRADLFISLHINAFSKRTARGSETYFCQGKASSKEAARVAALENSVRTYDNDVRKSPGYQIDVEEILYKSRQKMYWHQSGEFAKIFQNHFKKDLPFKSRGVNSANFYVLRRAKMPAILLETGFISNIDNEAKLRKSSVREGIVDAIIRGLPS